MDWIQQNKIEHSYQNVHKINDIIINFGSINIIKIFLECHLVRYFMALTRNIAEFQSLALYCAI